MNDTYGCNGHKIATLSGRYLDFADPKPDQFTLNDIAWGLAGEYRYANQSRRRYTVAEHCVLGSRSFYDRDEAIAFMFHDAAEAFTGDCPKPLKNLLGSAWTVVEDRLHAVIVKKYNVEPFSDLVKRIDRRMLQEERPQVFPGENCQWKDLDPDYEPVVNLQFWSPERSHLEFLERLQELGLPVAALSDF